MTTGKLPYNLQKIPWEVLDKIEYHKVPHVETQWTLTTSKVERSLCLFEDFSTTVTSIEDKYHYVY